MKKPKFKVGDKVRLKNPNISKITFINKDGDIIVDRELAEDNRFCWEVKDLERVK